MSSSESFFTEQGVSISAEFSEFSLLPSQGYSLLVRAKRYGRWWLLKALKEPYRHDSMYQTLLRKEYEITCQLQHPMVVTVVSLEEVAGYGLCIVMEWIEGITLRQWLSQEHPSLSQRLHVADMLLEAVAYVHSRQTQHRDLKPSNVMLTSDGQHLKLIDFGLSDTDSHAILKAPAGTENYMAPEGPSDVYALGCILRQLNLGWRSRAVISRCLAPLPQRYADVSLIQRHLRRWFLWPQRAALILCLVVMAAMLFLAGLSHNRQQVQALSDSIAVVSKANKEEINIQKSKTDSINTKADSIRQQVERIHTQQEAEQSALQQRQAYLSQQKSIIDRKMKATGFQQMLDTATCKRYITLPGIRQAYDLLNATPDLELKQYIETHYCKPWLKRIDELPY